MFGWLSDAASRASRRNAHRGPVLAERGLEELERDGARQAHVLRLVHVAHAAAAEAADDIEMRNVLADHGRQEATGRAGAPWPRRRWGVR